MPRECIIDKLQKKCPKKVAKKVKAIQQTKYGDESLLKLLEVTQEQLLEKSKKTGKQ